MLAEEVEVAGFDAAVLALVLVVGPATENETEYVYHIFQN
jgi:hypothetical protein